MSERQSVIVEGEVEIVLHGSADQSGRAIILKTRGDGTLEVWSKLAGLDPDNRERVVALENDGTLRASAVGTDPSGNTIGLGADAQGLLRFRGFEPWRFVDTAEPTPGGAYDNIYTVPASSIAVVEWRVVATAGTPFIDVHAVESGGTPDTSNAEVIGASPPIGGLPLRGGPIQLHAGGTVQCRNTAAGGSTGNVRIWLELYSTGDTV